MVCSKDEDDATDAARLLRPTAATLARWQRGGLDLKADAQTLPLQTDPLN